MLDQATMAMIKEAFGGHQCCECGFTAQRMRKGVFYCEDHYHRDSRNNTVVKVRIVKEPSQCLSTSL